MREQILYLYNETERFTCGFDDEWFIVIKMDACLLFSRSERMKVSNLFLSAHTVIVWKRQPDVHRKNENKNELFVCFS